MHNSVLFASVFLIQFGCENKKQFIWLWKKALMPCPFTCPKIFCAGPNFLSQTKNLTAFSASSKTFVPAQKSILLNAIIFLSGTKCLWLPQYVNNFLVWHKKFGPAQNILGPVKGQGISYKLWQSQTFCARQKDDLHSVKLIFVPAQKFLKRH